MPRGLMASQFTGFPDAAFAFLRDLAAEQNRPWFEEHKPVYENDVRWPMIALIADLTTAFTRRGLPLQGEPKRSVFRIHRDVRFSRDKSPYKTNIGAVLTRDGGKDSPGLLYIHVEPGRCFTAAGFYHPEPDWLQAMRTRILAKPAAWRALRKDLASRGLALAPDDEAMKRLPRGFDAVTDPDLAEAMKRRSFIIRQPLEEAQTKSEALIPVLVDFAERAMPLLAFGWRAAP